MLKLVVWAAFMVPRKKGLSGEEYANPAKDGIQKLLQPWKNKFVQDTMQILKRYF